MGQGPGQFSQWWDFCQEMGNFVPCGWDIFANVTGMPVAFRWQCLWHSPVPSRGNSPREGKLRVFFPAIFLQVHRVPSPGLAGAWDCQKRSGKRGAAPRPLCCVGGGGGREEVEGSYHEPIGHGSRGDQPSELNMGGTTGAAGQRSYAIEFLVMLDWCLYCCRCWLHPGHVCQGGRGGGW